MTIRHFSSLFLFIPFLLTAAPTVKIKEIIPLSAQTLVHVRVTDTDGSDYTTACTYRVSEGTSFSSNINDVNTSLFTSSNLDSRSGAIINGADHWMPIGTVGGAQKALDSKFYSRALQTNFQYWVGVTCGAATEVTTTFTTANIPYGKTFPEQIGFDANAPFNIAAPTIDFTTAGATAKYIDPVTGLAHYRASGPTTLIIQNYDNQQFDFARDLGSAWTNVQYAITAQNPVTLASIATHDAPLFISWNTLQDTNDAYDNRSSPYDFKLIGYGNGANGAIISACHATGDGTCVSATVDMTMPASTGIVTIPATYPTSFFSGWQPLTAEFSGPQMSNGSSWKVNVNGSTVTWVSQPSNNYFWIARPVGSKLLIPGSAPTCTNSLCTVAAWSQQTITLQESLPAPLNNASMQDYGWGIKVWLKNTGGSPSANVSFMYSYVNGANFAGTSVNGAYDACSPAALSDVPTYTTGYFCAIGIAPYGFLFIPATGEIRLMTDFYQTANSRLYVPAGSWDPNDGHGVYGYGNATQHLYHGVIAPPYTAYVPSPTFPPTNTDNVTWTQIDVGLPITTQVKNAGGAVATALNTGLFPDFRFLGMLNGSPTYTSSSFFGDAPCLVARANGSNTLAQAFTSWETAPLRWGGCHFGAAWLNDYMAISVNLLWTYNSTLPLGGPFAGTINSRKKNGSFVPWTITATGVSSSIGSGTTTVTATDNGLDTNVGNGHLSQVNVSGGSGNCAALNGLRQVQGNGDSFTIPVEASSCTSAAGITFTASPPMIHCFIIGISGTTTGVVACNQEHRLQDGDPIGFGNLNQSTQWYAKVTGQDATHFAVYTDSSLTTPASAASIAGAGGGMAYFAETCPVNAVSILFDSGASGVRCFTVKYNGEPCSWYATSTEHGSFPCPADSSNTTKSSLQGMQVGDFIIDPATGPYGEQMVVIVKTVNSPTDIDVTFMRWWGNQISIDQHTGNNAYATHQVGWQPIMAPAYRQPGEVGFVSLSDPTHTLNVMNPLITSSHGDIGRGCNGLFSYVGGTPDAFVNQTANQFFNQNLTYTHNDAPVWNRSAAQFSYSTIESYPSERQSAAPCTRFYQGLDWRAVNPAFGGSPGAAFPLFNRSMSLVGGTSTVYLVGSATTVNELNYKTIPFHGHAGRYLLKDISGPSAVISDATPYSYCIALAPNECITGSVINNVYAAVPHAFVDNNCWGNNLSITSPCIFALNSLGNMGVEKEVYPVDTTGARERVMSSSFNPNNQYSFKTWVRDPTAGFAFISTEYLNGLRNEMLYATTPPPPNWTGDDNPWEDRTQFVSYKVTLSASQFANARARFGYAQNGTPEQFYCTARQDACSTEVHGSDPFSYVAIDSVSHTSCSGGCTLTIPAVPGRMLYYVIDRLDSGGAVKSTSAVNVAVVR